MTNFIVIDEELQVFTSAELYRRGAELYNEAKINKKSVGLLGINFSDTVKIRSMLGGYASMAAQKEMVGRVLSILPDKHLVGKGTDGLIILIPNFSKEQTLELAEAAATSLNSPYEYEGYRFDIAPTITVNEYPGEMGYIDVNEVSRIWGAFIDMAEMSDAQINILNSEDLFLINEKQRIDYKLFKAIENEELYLVYQPRVDMRTNRIIGCEALLRWENPDLGNVSPSVFIPRAEASGMIHSITPWVIQKAAMDTVEFRKKFGKTFTTSVNLSPANIHSPNLMSSIGKALSKSEVKPEYLAFEITESLLLENKTIVTSQLNSIRKSGAQTALDDFGTGFSSLSLLTRIPLDVLKIDQSFVQRLDNPDCELDIKVIKAIKDLGEACGLQIIAEGMETRSQVDVLLNQVDVQYGQGYFFGYPLRFQEFLDSNEL